MARSSEGKKEQASLEDAVLRASRKWLMAKLRAGPGGADLGRAEQQLHVATADLLKHEGVLP